MKGISALIKLSQGSLFVTSTHNKRSTQQEGAVYKSRGGSALDPESADTLILNFQSLEL